MFLPNFVCILVLEWYLLLLPEMWFLRVVKYSENCKVAACKTKNQELKDTKMFCRVGWNCRVVTTICGFITIGDTSHKSLQSI